MNHRILVASGNADERAELRAAMDFEGHDVAEATTPDEVLRQACGEPCDLLVMDSAIGGIAADRLCRAIRGESNLGIIVWGGRVGTTAIDSLDAGADDFVPSPFGMPEMLARIRAILRRVARPGDEKEIILEDRAINLRSRRIKGPGNREIRLTPKEVLVLKYLVSNANRLMSHQALAQSVWQRDAVGEVEYMRIVIKQLRRKIEPDPDNPRYILTERAAGYRFELPSESRYSALNRYPIQGSVNM